MTSARSSHADLGYAGLLMRADDFFALGETQDRYELINGVMIEDLHIDDLTVYRPNLCVYAAHQHATIPERLAVAPDVLLEVLSPGSKPLDLITKRDAYERFGVKEYWTIDPDDARVRAWALHSGQFRENLPEGGSAGMQQRRRFHAESRANPSLG
jgi:hypothetical protein